jgi:Protein of unknown function (DUF1684)
LLVAPAVTAQNRDAVLRDRQAFATWLTTGSTSPYAVLTQRAIGPGLSLGPDGADVPLEQLPLHRIIERGGVAHLEVSGNTRPLPRYRAVPLGAYRIRVAGPAGRAVVTVYATAPRKAKPPSWYEYDQAMVFTVTLRPAANPRTRRILAADGLEAEAVEAGTVSVSVGGTTTALHVLRIPEPTGEESDFEIYFRDATSEKGTYPAGRFVSLEPLGGNRYRLDFNRARNPFCAYSTAFACPLPWRGNSLLVAIEAGEKYTGGGLTPPQVDPPR